MIDIGYEHPEVWVEQDSTYHESVLKIPVCYKSDCGAFLS